MIQFEVRDGARLVACAVSDEALDAVSGLAMPSSTALRRRAFDRFRGLIDAAAKLKIKTLSPGWVGPLTISSGDLRSVPPTMGMPLFGTSPRGG